MSMSKKKNEKETSEDIMITEEIGLNVAEMIKKLKEIMPLVKEYATLEHQYNIMLSKRYELVEKSEDAYEAIIHLNEKIPFRRFSYDHFKCVATDRNIDRVSVRTNGTICIYHIYHKDSYSSDQRCYDLKGIIVSDLIELECNLREILPKIENDLRTWIEKYGQLVETLKKIVATLEMVFK
jgi:hypothetical protein